MKFKQIGWVTLGVLLAGVVVTTVFFSSTSRMTSASVPLVLIGAFVLLFGWLTVWVEADRVRLVFGIGLIRRSWPLANITRVRPVRNPLWTGWGIRIGPGYMLYNVSGRDAVELKLRDGTAVRIGTDQPTALAAAIAAHLSLA